MSINEKNRGDFWKARYDEKVEYAEKLAEALRHILDCLGTGKCDVNTCEGCRYEVADAIATARAALATNPNPSGPDELCNGEAPKATAATPPEAGPVVLGPIRDEWERPLATNPNPSTDAPENCQRADSSGTYEPYPAESGASLSDSSGASAASTNTTETANGRS